MLHCNLILLAADSQFIAPSRLQIKYENVKLINRRSTTTVKCNSLPRVFVLLTTSRPLSCLEYLSLQTLIMNRRMKH